MRPCAIRRPPKCSPLKKRHTVQEELQEKKRTILPSLNDPPEEEHDDAAYHETEESLKLEKGHQAAIDFYRNDGHDEDESEPLELEEDELQFEPEKDHQAAINFYGNDSHDEDESEPFEPAKDHQAAIDFYRNDSHDEDMEGVLKDEDKKGQEADADGMMEDEMEARDGQEEEEGGGEVDEHVAIDEEEHHEVVQERIRRKELEVFVGGLHRDATEEDLKKVFSEVGELTEVRLNKDPLTQKNRGFAFLRFATVEQARHAIDELKQPIINGKRCGVAPCQNNTTLFVGNICKTWTKEILGEKIRKYGIDKFEDLTLVEDMKNEGHNRGFAFLHFSFRSDALDAFKRLQQRDVVFGTDRTAKISFADPLIELDDEIMAKVTKIFIDGLPTSWDEERVKEYLQEFGKIEKVELARNMPAAKRTDFGFITFDSHDAAVACAESINDTELSDGKKKVRIRARLSRPLQSGLSGRHFRGAYSIGHGSDLSSWSPRSRARGMSHMEAWRFARQSGHGVQSRCTFVGDYKQSLSSRKRHPVACGAPDRLGSATHLSHSERLLGQRSTVPNHGKVSLRDSVRQEERFSGSLDFVSRITIGRRSTDRHNYPLHRSEYLDNPPWASEGASRRPPLYEEETYDQRVERPAYWDSCSRDYSSISGAKRARYALDDLHPNYDDAEARRARARYEYSASSAASQYGESEYYGSEPARIGHDSHLEYEGTGRSYVGHSYGNDSHTSTMRYGQGGESRESGERLYCSYHGDYMPSREELHDGPHSPLYSSHGSTNVYLRQRRSGSYY